MSTLTIPLPDELRAVIEEEVARGGYASHTDYIHSLIRQDLKRVARERLKAQLLARVDDGESVEMDAADFKAMREEFLRTVTGRGEQ